MALLFALLFAAACAPMAQETPAAADTHPASTQTRSPAPTAADLQTAQPMPTQLLATATEIPLPGLCSPLRDIALSSLPERISNPYRPPAPGSDDPHQGVDLAVLLPNSRVAVEGHPVQAMLSGNVAAVIRDRFPYGNAVVIETALEDAQAAWWQPAQIPTAAPTLEYRAALTCPVMTLPAAVNLIHRSVYVLYAHLLQPPALNIGDPVACGQQVGSVGSSGNALSPHLHIETRVGPSGMTFASMAHYDNSATGEEMGSYCLWRISGLFQLVDPLNLLQLSAGR